VVTNKSYRAPQLNMRRSKISPSKIANTEVNPYTGEYLSAGERKLLFQKRNVSSANVFKKSGALVKTTPSTITPDINVTVLSKRVFVLENDVSFLAKALNKEAELEKKAQKQYEKDVKKVEEKKLRSGEEKQLEKKITKGLISPVKAVGKKAGGVLGTLMELFMTLLGGWLTNQGLEAIKANAEGNIGKLESIAAEVGKTLLIVGGIFALLNGGILGIIGTIGAITAAIIAAPFKFAFRKLRELVTGKPKPPGGGGKPGGGINSPGNVPGTSISSGNRAGSKPPGSSGSKSTFGLEQQRKAATQKNMLSQNKPNFIMKKFRSILAQFETTKSGRGIAKAINWMKGSWIGKVGGYFAKKTLGAFQWVKDYLSPKGMGKVGSKLGRALKIGGPLVTALFSLGSIVNRSNSGMSPAQAILPELLRTVLSVGGATLGAGAGLGWLSPITAIAGSFAGDWLGGQIMNWADAPERSGIWDSKIFDGFNNAVRELSLNNEMVGKIFPYDTGLNGKTANPQSPAAPAAPEASVPEAMPAAQISSPSSPSMPAPGPVSGGGNTTVIYKKVGGSGGQMQGQPLKSGSATDVPLIASADPSNFYTMYSQLLYNVVG
jgi:hypothetical protein